MVTALLVGLGIGALAAANVGPIWLFGATVGSRLIDFGGSNGVKALSDR